MGFNGAIFLHTLTKEEEVISGKYKDSRVTDARKSCRSRRHLTSMGYRVKGQRTEESCERER